MEQMENFLKTETEEDPQITALADEIRAGLQKCFEDSLSDENSDNRIGNVLLDDDCLLEELLDRVSILNIMEAAAGGRLQKGSKEDPPEEVTKEELEQAYLSVLDSLFELSKIVNPLSGVGADRLSTGLSMIREFEKLYWPLSTKVTDENIFSFKEFLPEEQFHDVMDGNKHAIGALRHVGEEVYAAGVIVYTLPTSLQGERPEIILDYIYVHEDLTEMGIGNFLMAEVLGLALQNEGTAIRVMLPVEVFDEEEEAEDAAVLYQFLDEWGFGFSITTGNSFGIKISDLEGNRLVDQPYNSAESLSSLGVEGQTLLADFFGELEDPARPELADLPYTFFDRNLSCVILKDKKIKTALLFHSFPSGNVRYEGLLSVGKPDPVDATDLACFAYQACRDKGNTDAFVYGDFITADGPKIGAKLLPKAHCPMQYNGLLLPDEEAFTSEEWEDLRMQAGLIGNMIPEEGIREE